ncbi:NAD kinase [Candidatus Saccharibacteria bacterium]|nr:NAD kinase [Candidatus Saccharibacteria bacterium]
MCRFKSCLGHHTLDRRTQKAALGRLRRASPVPKRHTILKSMMTNDNLKSFAIVSRRDTDSEGVAKKIRERLQSLNYTEDLDTPDEVIVVGGDGSFLYAVHKYTDILEKTVFIGVHTGTLGFFMDYKDTELDEFIADITPGDLPIEEYPVLEIRAGDETHYAINEMRLENIFRTQTVSVYLDNEKFEDFRGTGLLISTQLGSTAYNRSLGGAVIQKGLPALELTEIAGIHHRAYRSLGTSFVVSDKTVITLESDSFDKAKLGFDTEIMSLDTASSITVRVSDSKKLKIMRGKKIPYFERIRQLF